MPMTPAQRSLRAKVAAQARWARLTPEQRRQQTQPARDGFARRFDTAADPERARTAHMTGLSLKSSRQRGAA
jgi:hypothetical protein